jgi:endonuclease-3
MATKPAKPADDSTRVRQIVAKLARTYPKAKLELDFETPLELLVALILAAQFRDDRVNEITPALFARFKTARDYATARENELQSYLREVNFFRKKTRGVQACARALVEHFDGEVPRDLAALITLPWVGRKTANILRGNAFGEPAIGVDRHVQRVSGRIGLSHAEDPDRVEADLCAVTPKRDWVRLCHLFQLHGRRVCVARAPRCDECVIRELCDFGRSGASVATPGGKRGTTARAKASSQRG